MGALFGIIVIIAALIYIPYKLYSEATPDQKGVAKGGCLFLCIEALALLALFGSMNVLMPVALSISEGCGAIVGVIYIIIVVVGFVAAYVKADKFEDPEKKAKREQEIFETRTENFLKDLVLPPIAAEVLAKQYRLYSSDYSYQDAYRFVNGKFSSFFKDCPKEFITEVIGFNEDHIPEGTSTSRRIAIVEVIVEKFGLRFHIDHSEVYGFDYREISQIRKLIDNYYQDVIKFDPSLITSDTICYKGNPLNTKVYKFRKALRAHGYDIYSEGYEILEKEYNKDPDDLDGHEIYQWLSRKVSDEILYYTDKDFERELGITKKDFPENFTLMQREYTLKLLCAEKLGLRYMDNSCKDYIKENKDVLVECKTYTKTHYSNILHERASRIYFEKSNETSVDPKLIYKRLSAAKALKDAKYDLAPEVFEFIKKESTSVWGSFYDFYNVSEEYAEKVLLYEDPDFERELGITCNDLPGHYWDKFKQSVLRRLCMQKLGLDCFKIKVRDENEWKKCREYIITNYADILFEKAPRIKL